MIDWKPEAIKAALRAYAGSVIPDEHGVPRYNMRAALNAAVTAQGLIDDLSEAHGLGYIAGRAAAIEECAKVAEARVMGDCNREDAEAKRIAAAIRALAEKDGGNG